MPLTISLDLITGLNRSSSSHHLHKTINAKPGAVPSDAIVFFDGRDLSKWKGRAKDGNDSANWQVKDGFMEVVRGTGSIQTRNQVEGDCQLPIWELAGNYTGCMIGYHAIPVIVDAYVKGLREFDLYLALKAMINSANKDHLGLNLYSIGHVRKIL